MALVLLGLVVGHGSAAQAQEGFTSAAVLVMDAHSGQTLFTQNGDQRLYPASTTKLLTALVALTTTGAAERVATGPAAYGMKGNSCYLQLGEEQLLLDLVLCMLVASGNDAAVALAEHAGGDEAGFADLMNEKAARLGAADSHFTNAHGLHHPDHYTTAHNLALIMRAVLAEPQVRLAAGTLEFTLPGQEDNPRTFANHNHLLSTYPGSVAGKYGFTDEAGYTLVHAATRAGRTLIGVVLGSTATEVYTEMARLLDLGFAHFGQAQLVAAGEVLGRLDVAEGRPSQVSVAAAAAFYTAVPAGGSPTALPIRREIRPVPGLKGPVQKGQRIAELHLWQGDDYLGSVDLVAAEPVAHYIPPVHQTVNSVVGTAYRVQDAIVNNMRHAWVALPLVVGWRLTVLTLRRRRRRQRRGPPRRGRGPVRDRYVTTYRPPRGRR